jgi:photosystem II stability/assembly factor-like uncharacterized protein
MQKASFGFALGLTFLASTLTPTFSATTLLWTNTSGGNWTTAANWSPNAVPTGSDSAWITNAGTYRITNSVASTVNSLTLGNPDGLGVATLVLPAGAFTVTNATLATNAVILVNGGTLLTAGPAALAGTINQASGIWQLKAAVALGAYNLTNGTLRGGTLTVTNFNWTDGTLYAEANGDQLIIPPTGTFNLLGAAEKSLFYYAPANKGYGIDNYGTWNWSGACVLRGFGSTVNNAGTVTVTAAGNAQYSVYSGYAAPTWNNTGPFTKSAGAGIFYFNGCRLDNSSTLDAQAGTFSIYNSVFNNTGPLSAAGSLLQFYGGSATNWAAITLSAATQLSLESGGELALLEGSSLVAPLANAVRVTSGTLFLRTTNVTTPSVWINGGTLWQQTNNVVDVVNQSAGTWRLSLATGVNIYNLTNGILRGGTLTVTNFNWTDGGLYADANGDKLIIPATGMFNLLGTAEKSLFYYAPANKGYGLDNYGTWNWSGACVLRGFGSTVNNYGSVTLTAAGNAQYSIYTGYGAPTWNNLGSFTKTTGTGIFYFNGSRLDNSGTLDAQSGTLSIYNSTFNNTGPLMASGSLLQFYGGSSTNSAAISISGATQLVLDNAGELALLEASSLTAPTASSVRITSGTLFLRTTNVATPAFLINGGTLYQQTNNVVDAIHQSAGVWRLALPTSINTYNLTNGNLRGGTLVVTNFNWTDGTLYADANGDKLIIPAAGTFNLLGAAEKSLFYYAPANKGYGLDNYGTWNWSGACVLRGFGSTVNNYGSVTVTASGNPYYSYYPGYSAPTWNNSGAFTKTTGAGSFYFSSAIVNNTGLLAIQSGTLSFNNSAVTNAAAIGLTATGILTVDGSSEVALLPASTLSAPVANSVRFNAGTTYLNTTNVATPALWLNGGTLHQLAPNVVDTINESAGVWRLALPASINTYNLTNGILRGGTLTVTNFNWTDGTLYADANGDKLIIPAAGTFNLLGAGEKSLFYYAPATRGYGLDNYGTWNWSGACILRGFGSTVNNYGSVTVTASGNPYYSYYPGYSAPTWNNSGAFTKTTGTGSFYFSSAIVNNTGLLANQSGTLSFNNSAVTNAAAIGLTATGILTVDGSSEVALLPASTLSAPVANSVRFNAGTTYLNTTNVATPALWLNGGTLHQLAPNVVDTINESAGVWRLALPTSINTYNLTNGILRGGTLTVTNFNWTDGGLYADANGDKLIIPAAGTFNLLGAAEKSLYYYAPANKGYGIDNYGTWNWSGGCLLRGFVSTVNNHGSVLVTASGTPYYSYYPGYGAPTWNNSGSFTKTTGTGSFIFNTANLNNTGWFNSQSGTLNVANTTFTNSAAITLSASGLFTVEGTSEVSLLPASTLSAPTANSVRFNGGTTYLNTTNVATPALWINGGTLHQLVPNVVDTINESAGVWRLALPASINTYNLTNGILRGGTLTVTNFNWTDGGLYADANGDKLIIPPTGTFNLLGAAEKWLYYYAPANRGYGIDNHGTWNWSGACVLRGFVSTVNNAGSVIVTAPGTIHYSYYPGYGAPSWNNTGSFTKTSGAGIFHFNGCHLDNAGSLNNQSGTLSILGSSFTNSAAISLSSTGILVVEGASEVSLLPASTLSAPVANSVRFTAGTTYLNTTNVATPAFWINGGTLYQLTNNVVATINESAGQWRLGLPVGLHAYNLTNGTLRGASLTVTNFNWSEGTLYADANGDKLTIPPAGTLNLVGSAEKALFYNAPATKGYGLDNYGTCNWSGACVLRGFNNTVNNYGTVNVAATTGTAQFSYYPGYGAPVWNNLGTFSKLTRSNLFHFSSAIVTNSGTITSAGGSVRLGNLFVQNAGVTSLSTNFVADGTVRIDGGGFTGQGSVASTLVNASSLNPGASPGVITATHFTNTAAGITTFELGGLVGGTNYDQIRLSGTASLTGLVQVVFANGFTPTVGNSFTVMTYTARSGAFENLTAPIGYNFQPVYTSTNLILNAVAFSNVPPVITLHPSNRTVFAGTTVRFEAAATGTDPLNFQWKHNGVTLPGATNTWYEIVSAQSSNAGVYRVEVSNLGGFATSSNAVLAVVPGFTFGTNFNLPVTVGWNGVALQNSRVLYLAGPNGTVLASYNGGVTWSSVGPGVANTLYSVQVIDGAIFVFGSGGHICVSYDGGLTWQLFQTGTTETFYSGHLTDFTSGWAVGTGGTIYQFTNNSWLPNTPGGSADYHGIWSYGGSAWAVGSGGSICRWNGSWTCISYGSGLTFYGVSFWPGGINGLAVGSGGTIYRTTDGGNSWFPVTSGTGADLLSVTTATSGGVDYAWIGGSGGTLLFTSNGGGSWNPLGTGTTVNITGVSFVDGYGVYCADDGSCRHFNFAPITPNLPPAVTMLNQGIAVTNLASGLFSQLACVPLNIFALADDPDGVVTNLEFTVASRFSTTNFPPRKYPRRPGTYSFQWVNDLVGEFSVSATATDNRGATATAIPLTINAIKGPPLTIVPGGFHTTNGSFKLCLCAETNGSWTVLANQDLKTTNWVPIGPMVFTNDLWRYFDLDATNFNYRFYRARQDP